MNRVALACLFGVAYGGLHAADLPAADPAKAAGTRPRLKRLRHMRSRRRQLVSDRPGSQGDLRTQLAAPESAATFATMFTHGKDSHGAIEEDVASAQKVSSPSSQASPSTKAVDISKPVQLTLPRLVKGCGGSGKTHHRPQLNGNEFRTQRVAGVRSSRGTKFFYNTPAYAIMKPVLEKASGQNLDDITRLWLTELRAWLTRCGGSAPAPCAMSAIQPAFTPRPATWRSSDNW